MNRERSVVRKRAAVGAAGLMAVAGLGIAHAPFASTAPVSLTLNYTCPFPLIGAQPMTVKITSDIPTTLQVGQPSGQFNIDATATVNANATSGLSLVGATTLEGTAVAGATVNSPDANLSLKVPTTIAKTPLPASGAFDVVAHGTTPSLTFTKAGPLMIMVGDLLLTLSPKDANGALTGLGTFDSACTQDAGQNNMLAQGNIVPAPTTTAPPTTVPPTTVPPTTVPPTTVPPTTVPPTTTPPTTTPPTTTPPTTKPPTTTTPPTTAPPGGPIKLAYNVSGSTFVKAPNGTVPVNGNIKVDFNLATGTYTGDIAINPTGADFAVFGFLPVSAHIEFSQAAKTTGTFTGGKLTASASLNVSMPMITVFGAPLSNDPACGTATPAKIDLTSTGTFDPFKGGTLTGTYTLPPLKGCGFLNDFISSLTSGPGNTIQLTLAKQP